MQNICKQILETSPKYLMIIDGVGDGCDYTIACNMLVVTLKATNIAQAVTEAEEYFEEEIDYLAREPNGEKRTAQAIIVPIDSVSEFPFERALQQRIKKYNSQESEALEDEERKELARLQAKYKE